RRGTGPAAGRRCGRRRLPGRTGALALAGLGQLHRPGLLLAGVDLEEAGAVEAAREAIPGATDGELLFAGAHEGLARPLAAMIVIHRINVIEPCRQRPPQQRVAIAPRHAPPP